MAAGLPQGSTYGITNCCAIHVTDIVNIGCIGEISKQPIK